MRLHEYIRALNPQQRTDFDRWRRSNSQQIFKLKQKYPKKLNQEQQYQFESKIVLLHQNAQSSINTI